MVDFKKQLEEIRTDIVKCYVAESKEENPNMEFLSSLHTALSTIQNSIKLKLGK